MKKITVLVVLLACLGLAGTARALPVGLELALLVDVSGSVDSSEYALQKNGYINVFNNIASFGSFDPFAVTYIEWAGSSEQAQLVQWTLITDLVSAQAFASSLAATSRAFSGLTAPGSAINYTLPLFDGNGFEGSRLVIDVSGDGSQNSGTSTSAARDAAVAAGFTINGLPILGSESGLDTWYQNNVIGGPGSFITVADSFADFQDAVFQKLEREVVVDPVATPEPASMLLVCVGLLGMGSRRLRRRS
ncbi:PEP motif putative anchor domain protein [Desulfovibrio sp. X2]|uniref:DUF1194 domain-containing protein n=1 Tax=Desulfovibrio sp. X2 TaxID=941449 RepID=UPI00035872F2|nr:DUF1194 domain-containing protein [Desulfovibrio sp. X2]EPR38657.1 PEP motif putative anchor domain protein [Desulfovibrio sp. X2]